MSFAEDTIKSNPIKYYLLFIVSFNIFVLYKFGISGFDQILNLIISFGLLSFYSENNFKYKENLSIFQITFSFL